MAPPRGGGEASLKEQKEAGLEQGDGDSSSGHEVGLMRPPALGGGDWEKADLGPPPPPLIRAMVAVEVVAMEPVTMGSRAGRLRNREERREGGTPAAPGPPSSMWPAAPSRVEMGN